MATFQRVLAFRVNSEVQQHPARTARWIIVPDNLRGRDREP